LAIRLRAFRRSGKVFDQKDFSKSMKRKLKNKPIKKMSTITATDKASDRPKFMRYNTAFSRLLKLVLNMTEREQLRLLEYAKTIIDERTLPRNICMIPVNCKVEDRTCDGLILDINSYGAYVYTDESFPIGQEIYLSFFNPFSDKYMDLVGKIIWSNTNGIGVSFNDVSRARYIW